MTLAVLTEARSEVNTDALERCLIAIGSGDKDALGELYTRTSAAVYSFALSMVKSPHDAEDILHDSYLSIHSAAAFYRPNGKPMAWIMTIAKNHSLMHLRERGRTADLPDEEWESFLADEDRLTHEDRIVLRQCLTFLSEEELEIVTLKAIAGFRHREISELLQLPLPTVLSKYNRAIKKLRNILEKENCYDRE